MKSRWPTRDELFKLAKEDPAQLESLRAQEIEALITSAPESMQRRLRGLQFQIDAKRSLSKTPMASCLAISQMMFDSVYELNNALHGEGKKAASGNLPKAGELLKFPCAL
jgi:hypothetical protein